MEINSNLAHTTLILNITPKAERSNENITETLKSSPTPSTIVTISNQGLELVKQAQQEGIDTYVEKSDTEYAKMSYEALIDERNGGKDANWFLGGGATNGIRINGKAASAASAKLSQQMWENATTAVALKNSLKTFKESVAKINPTLAKGNFDVSFIDGKATIVNKTLSKEDAIKIQKILDDKKNPSAAMLKNDIAQYNDAALKHINMMIYDEKGTYGGADSIYVHRNTPLTMKEFTANISYESVSLSSGGYTYQKHSEVIGSTNYGSKLVYKSI